MAEYASRYARALADIVMESKLDPKVVDGELADFAAAWSESRPLRGVFLDPSIPAEKKVSILDRMNEQMHLSGTVRNFIAVLSNHERMEGFEEVLQDYRREMNARLGVSRVEVTTARALGDDERHSLEEKIAKLTGTAVTAVFHEDPSLLGGAQLRIGSTVYDGSVRGRLAQLKEKLAAS